MNRALSGSGPFLPARYGSSLRIVDDEPGPESADVPVREPRPVVEFEHRALVRRRLEAEAPRHAKVNEERDPALEPKHEVLPAPSD